MLVFLETVLLSFILAQLFLDHARTRLYAYAPIPRLRPWVVDLRDTVCVSSPARVDFLLQQGV